MKSYYFLILLITLLIPSCKKIAKGTPVCIINEINKSPKLCDEGGSASSYTFQHQIVYVISDGPCLRDGSALVLDSECNELGRLGGIRGNLTINGENFNSKAVFVEVIWEQ